jgi:hypothetical protein
MFHFTDTDEVNEVDGESISVSSEDEDDIMEDDEEEKEDKEKKKRRKHEKEDSNDDDFSDDVATRGKGKKEKKKSSPVDLKTRKRKNDEPTSTPPKPLASNIKVVPKPKVVSPGSEKLVSDLESADKDILTWFLLLLLFLTKYTLVHSFG